MGLKMNKEDILEKIEFDYRTLTVEEINSFRDISFDEFSEINNKILRKVHDRIGKGEHFRLFLQEKYHIEFFKKENGNNSKNSEYQNVLATQLQRRNQTLIKDLDLNEKHFKVKDEDGKYINLPSSGAFNKDALEERGLTKDNSEYLKTQRYAKEMERGLFRSFTGFILKSVKEVKPSEAQLSTSGQNLKDFREEVAFKLNDMVLSQIKNFGTTKANTVDLNKAQTQTKIYNDIRGNFLNIVVEKLYGSRNAGSKFISISTSIELAIRGKDKGEEITTDTTSFLDGISEYQDFFSKNSKSKLTEEYWNDVLLKVTPYMKGNPDQVSFFNNKETLSILEMHRDSVFSQIKEKYPYTTDLDAAVHSSDDVRTVAEIIPDGSEDHSEVLISEEQVRIMEEELLKNKAFSKEPVLIYVFLAAFSTEYADIAEDMIADAKADNSPIVDKLIDNGHGYVLSAPISSKFSTYLNKKLGSGDQDGSQDGSMSM
jgi:hypothetical protein